MIQQLADFIRLHWVKCLALLLVHLFLLVTIGLQNVPYIDDTGRRLWGEGLTNWGPDDGRWGSHYLNMVLTGSRWRLVDLGLTTFVISAVILTAAALIVIYLLVGQQANWLTFAVSIGFTLNPWALGILAFRFDGPFGAVSILLAVLPLLWFGSSALIAIVISALSIFLMANFYQHSFGIAICLLLLVALVRYLAGQMALREVLRAIAVTVSGFALGIVLYLLQLAIIPATNDDYNSRLVLDSQLFNTISRNFQLYVNAYIQDSNRFWLLSFFLVLALGITSLIAKRAIRLAHAITAITMVLLIGVPASGSFAMIAAGVFAGSLPRFRMGLAAFLAFFAIAGSALFSTRWNGITTRYQKGVVAVLLVPYAYFMFSFPFVFSTALKAQDDALVQQTQVIMANVLPVLREADNLFVDENTLFFDAPVLIHAREVYPMLGSLIKENNEFWWPQWARFREVSGILRANPLVGGGLGPWTGSTFGLYPTPSREALNVVRCAEDAICVFGPNG